MNNVLIHYGVKGMKWGVRRYQNYDGSRVTGVDGKTYSKETLKKRARHDNELARKNRSTFKQDRLSREIRKNPGNVAELVRHNISKRKLRDLSEKHAKCIEATTAASDDYNKKFSYSDAYEIRSLKWAVKDMKKNDPETYNQCLEEAEKGKFDILDHKAVHYYAEGYIDVEPYNPPETKLTKAADKAWDDYYNSCKSCTSELIGKHGKETVNLLDQRYGGAYGDTVERYVMMYLEAQARG